MLPRCRERPSVSLRSSDVHSYMTSRCAGAATLRAAGGAGGGRRLGDGGGSATAAAVSATRCAAVAGGDGRHGHVRRHRERRDAVLAGRLR